MAARSLGASNKLLLVRVVSAAPAFVKDTQGAVGSQTLELVRVLVVVASFRLGQKAASHPGTQSVYRSEACIYRDDVFQHQANNDPGYDGDADPRQ
jgi:hypothetical protein